MILTERLTINGEEVAIAGYNVKAPTNALAQSVTIALVEPLPELLPDGAEITFELGAGKADISGNVLYSYAPPIIEGGRLNGRSYSVSWLPGDGGGSPNDVLQFTAMSPLAERLTLSPERPLTMFDPEKVRESDLRVPDYSKIVELNAQTGQYERIEPILEAVENLMFYKILDRAYTNRSVLEGVGASLGFDRVITNIPDFAVDSIEFTFETGWHNPVKTLYQLYKPEFFESENILYILSPEYGLPPGIDPLILPHNCVIELSRTEETSSIINAIQLVYKRNLTGQGTAGEEIDIEIIHETPVVSGEGESYVREETSREIVTFTDENTGAIRRIEESWIETKTFAYRPSRTVTTDGDGVTSVTLGAGEVVLIMEERTVNTYSGNTKSGHSRTVDALYLNALQTGAPYKYGRVLDELCSLSWRPDLSHPGEYEQVRCEIKTSGLCLVENIEIEEENPLDSGQKIKYIHKIFTPILDAADTGLVTGEFTQTLETKPISTILETLRDTGQNQSNIETRTTNHLTGGAKTPQVQSRPGSRSTYLPPFSVKFGGGAKAGQVRELIKNQTSIDLYGLRTAETLDIGKLDPAEGRKIARRRLRVAETPPKAFTITLPGISFVYRRGLVLLPPLRSGFDNPVMITGLEITGRALNTSAALRDMTIEARELISAD